MKEATGTLENKNACLIAANGRIDCSVVKKLNPADFEKVIAADGAALKLHQCGFAPDVIIGDLDSIPAKKFKLFPRAELLHRTSQEHNDLEKVLSYCAEMGFSHLTLTGITGGRFDHSLNNFSVLCKYDQQFKMEIYDKFSRIFIVREYLHHQGKAGQTVSLIPLGIVTGVVTEGLKYPLNDETLGLGVREGASNSMTNLHFSVSVREGILLVFVNRI